MALPTIFENCYVQFSSVGTMGAAYIHYGSIAGSPIRCAPSTSVNLQPTTNNAFAYGQTTASVNIALPVYVDASFPPAASVGATSGPSFPIAYYNAQNSLIQDNWTRTAQ